MTAGSLQQPLTEPVDILLADIAIRLQLSRTNHSKAVERYRTISDWIEREGSPLKDRVVLFYSQGSMAVGATIISKIKADAFDIDVVAQLDVPADVSPRSPLDLLFESIRGEPGSRYYRMAKRRTRCVTVDYSDMHLDVTPAVRMPDTPERQSWIFHHQPEVPQKPGYKPVANPHGFAEWFKRSTPPDPDFASVFEARADEYEQRVLAEADKEPVPKQEPPFRKSQAVIVLQLLKRWRNVQYDKRSGLRPPSIVIAKLVADAAGRGGRLSEVLLHQARSVLDFFQLYHDPGQRVRVVNPVCDLDVLTDRWPGSLQDQAVFIHDLENLVCKVEQLIAKCDLAEMQAIMDRLFGEMPTADAFRDFNERVGETGGGWVQPASPWHRWSDSSGNSRRDDRIGSAGNAETHLLRPRTVQMMSMTIRKQVECMRRVWPDFPVLDKTSKSVRWQGQLHPLGQLYTVQIAFCRGGRVKGRPIPFFPPRVTVIEPMLRRRVQSPDEPIPHHYPNPVCPERPILCLYDPATNEWSSDKAIAKTIIPWAIDWLACYEG